MDLKIFVISTLRRASYRWPSRTEALMKARVSRGIYKCSLCDGEFGRKEIQVDHIEPVIPLEGWVGWDSFIDRLYCKSEGLSILCKPCHKTKTYLENELRKDYKKEKENATSDQE